MLIRLGAAAALGGLLVLFHPWRRAEPSPPPVIQDPSTDSLWLHSRGAAAYARQRAVDAGVPAKGLAGGDSLFEKAVAEAEQGRKPQAAVLMTSAAGFWAAAEKGAVPKTAAASAPAKPKETQGVTRPTVTGPAPEPLAAQLTPAQTESLAVSQYYDELKRAIDARQLAEIKRLLPNLSGKEEGQWRKLFEDRKVTAIEAGFFLRNIQAKDDQATAHVIYDLTVTKDGKTDMRQRDQQVLLSKGPQGWRQIRVEEGK
jgi:hypothetical protein